MTGLFAGFSRFLLCTCLRVFQPQFYNVFRMFIYAKATNIHKKSTQVDKVQLFFKPCAINQLISISVPIVFPGLGRLLAFYAHFLPVVAGYMKTQCIEVRLARLRQSDVQAVWNARHEWGADRMVKLLDKLSGFYVKVAQVFATKYDLLPEQYVRKMSFVFENCRPLPISEIHKIMHEELGQNVFDLFIDIQSTPMACATIAQVHVARMYGFDECVVIKVQRPTSEMLMNLDMKNMILVSRVMDVLGMHLPFDHTSVLLEYQNQIPMEFDFHRERMMMETLRKSIQTKHADILIPKSIAFASSKRIITMALMPGDSVARVLSNNTHQHFNKDAIESFSRKLLTVYGHQIFEVGIFHSDPHPGNLLIAPSGALTLLDFGLVKVLSDNVRFAFAQLIVAMSSNSNHVARCLETLGIRLDNCTPELRTTIAYVLFDTRMDLPEARMNPFEKALPTEIRRLRLSKIPQEVFMLVRIVALMRGMLTAFGVDIHSRHIWAPYAKRFLKKNNNTQLISRLGNVQFTNAEERMSNLIDWLDVHSLPHERKHMAPLALANIWDVHGLVVALSNNNMYDVLRGFTTVEQNKIKLMLLSSHYQCV